MKNITTKLLCLILLLTTSANAQNWVQQTSPNTKHIYSVAFSSATNGFAVGLNSNFIFTNDAGNTWTEVSGSNTIGEDLWTIDFPSSTYGYVGGTNGMLFRTINSGANWSIVSSPTAEDILKLDFINESTGMIVGTNGLVMKSTNNGLNWSSVTPSMNYHYTSLFMLNASTAWIGGSSGRIYKTTTGGNNWVTQSTGTAETIYDIKFTDANNGYAAATNGTFLKTTNGGINWTVFTIGSYTNHYFRLHFEDANTGWLIGQGGMILKTTNGGNNWSKEEVPQDVSAWNLINITKVGSAMYIVGTLGTILQYNAKSLKLNTPNGGETVAGGGTYNITWTSQNIENLKIDFSTDGGVNWNTITSSVSASSGNYTWNVPVIASKSVKVRISDVMDTETKDESDAYFEIKLIKMLTLNSPNGGEKITMGSTKTISWTSQNIQKINIYYSVNGGINWVSVASNIDAAPGSYSWAVPSVPSASAKIKIEAAEDVTVFDESNEYFTVGDFTSVAETKEKELLTVYPNPSAGNFVLQLNATKERGFVTVTDLTGKVVFSQMVQAFTNKIEINLPDNITNGLYLLNYQYNGAMFNSKLTIVK